MSEDRRTPIPTRQGDVLPALQPEPHTSIAPFGVGALTIARNWSERRQIESYNRLAAAKNALLEVYNEQCRLLVARGVVLERLENLPAIREAERLRINNEVARLRLEAETSNLRMSVEIEELKARLAEAKQRREQIENPGAARAARSKPSEADRIADAFAEINQVDGAMKAQRAAFVAGRGGEASLTDEDRAALEKLDIARAVLIEKLYEDIMQ